jgi:hypothetical protein
MPFLIRPSRRFLCYARLRQEDISSKGYSDLAPAMVCCAMSHNRSKALLLDSVMILFPHRWFLTMVWSHLI